MAWVKGLRSLLRQIVPDACRDDPVCVFAGELLPIGCWVSRVWSTVRISFQSNRGYADGRRLRELPFEVVVLRFAKKARGAQTP